MASDPRQITDSRVLAAMSHPQRRRLLDALRVDGPSTVSALAERLGIAVGSASHHIKVLAAAELVREAPELARDGRERWWQLSDRRLRWSTGTFAGDPAAAVVAEAAQSLELERHVEKVRAWNLQRDESGPAWRDGAFSTSIWLRLSPEELGLLSQELIELLDRWDRRAAPADGVERAPVFVFAHGVPAEP